MKIFKRNLYKGALIFFICLLVRLIPVRPPNIEPIMGAIMPISSNYGLISGFFFGFFSIVLYDLTTHTIGVWSMFTAMTYGALGVMAALYFRNKDRGIVHYVTFAVLGTIFFDVITGVIGGPILFHQSFYNAFIGQIPFTLMHLIGNITLSILVSPALDLYLRKERIEKVSIINLLKKNLYAGKKI